MISMNATIDTYVDIQNMKELVPGTRIMCSLDGGSPMHSAFTGTIKSVTHKISEGYLELCIFRNDTKVSWFSYVHRNNMRYIKVLSKDWDD